MLSLGLEAVGVDGPAVRASLLPPGDVLPARRSGDSMPRLADSQRTLHVLVVDDNRDAADSLSVLVNLWGHEARTAYDGAAALDMTVVRKPHVVLLDLTMPKRDGCQVARQLRQQATFADTLLIAITGWTDQVHRRLCDEAGFDHYLIKPIDLARLEILLLRERRLVRSQALIEGVSIRKTEVLPCWF